MNKKGFTLIELLAVIVILAIIALIATPIVLSIINNSKESAQLRSAEMYLKGVETSVATATINNKKVEDGSYPIMPEGDVCLGTLQVSNETTTCNGEVLEVQMNGEKPQSGTVTIVDGKITDIGFTYSNGKTIVKKDGKLVYEGSSSDELDMSTVSATLEENDWETIQKVVKAGKVVEAGWSVGDTKSLTIGTDTDSDGTLEEETMVATLIGINHDGENTATFITEWIGTWTMNSTSTNTGGWEKSELRALLNGDIYESMSNKDYIKEVTKYTNNIGQTDATEDISTGTQDKVFLLSVVEAGYTDNYAKDGDNNKTYTLFVTKPFEEYGWLRSPASNINQSFFVVDYTEIYGMGDTFTNGVFPAFVIG